MDDTDALTAMEQRETRERLIAAIDGTGRAMPETAGAETGRQELRGDSQAILEWVPSTPFTPGIFAAASN